MAADGSVSRNHADACRTVNARSRVLARIGAMLVALPLAWGSPSDLALSAIELQARESQAQASQARESQSRSGESREDNANEILEEIIVTAPRTLNSMRTEIDAAQNRAFALFNELNVDNDYDIVCRRETPTGSHIPVRTCRPRYVDRLEAGASQDFLAGDGYFDPTGDIMRHQDIFKQKLARMVEENPDFHAALEEFYRLKTAYEDERRERFRNSWFVR